MILQPHPRPDGLRDFVSNHQSTSTIGGQTHPLASPSVRPNVLRSSLSRAISSRHHVIQRFRIFNPNLPRHFIGIFSTFLFRQENITDRSFLFQPLAKQLIANEEKIVAGMPAVQDQPADIAGDYRPDTTLTTKAMRLSATFNDLLKTL